MSTLYEIFHRQSKSWSQSEKTWKHGLIYFYFLNLLILHTACKPRTVSFIYVVVRWKDSRCLWNQEKSRADCKQEENNQQNGRNRSCYRRACYGITFKNKKKWSRIEVLQVHFATCSGKDCKVVESRNKNHNACTFGFGKLWTILSIARISLCER